MNISTSPSAPIITVNQFKRALQKYPEAAELVLQKNATGSSIEPLESSFYGLPVAIIFGKETSKNQEITEAFFEALGQKYGDEIAQEALPSLKHRIELAHPLSAKTVDQAFQNAEISYHASVKEVDASLKTSPQLEKALKNYTAIQDALTKSTHELAATTKKMKSLHVTPFTNANTVLKKLTQLELKEKRIKADLISLSDQLAEAKSNFLAFREKLVVSSYRPTQGPSTAPNSTESSPLLTQQRKAQRSYTQD